MAAGYAGRVTWFHDAIVAMRNNRWVLREIIGQQILDVSEAQREAAIEPYGVLDDLGRESVATIGDLFYRWRLDCCHSTQKPINVTKPALIRRKLRCLQGEEMPSSD